MDESGVAIGAVVLLIIFNIIFILHGLAFIVGAAYVLATFSAGELTQQITQQSNATLPPEFADIIGQYYIIPFIVIIVYGSFILIFGLVGCVGAIVRNKVALGCYIYCLVFDFLVYLGFGIMILLGSRVLLQGDLTRSLFIAPQQTSGSTTPTPGTDVVGYQLQRQVMCCGADGYQDFKAQQVPLTCCILKDSSITKATKDLRTSDAKDYTSCQRTDISTGKHDRGCITWFNYYITIVIGVVFGLAGVELLLIIFASCLCCTTQKGKTHPMLKHRY